MTGSSFVTLSAAMIQEALFANDAANNLLRLILLLSRLEYNCIALHSDENKKRDGCVNNHATVCNNKCSNLTHLDGNKLLAVLLLHLCNFRITLVSR